MTLVVIDWIFLVIIAIFMIGALIKGFVNEIFGKASWIIGIILAIFFYSKLAVILQNKIANLILCNILAFLIIFAASYIILKIIGSIIHKIFQMDILVGIDKTLGAAFGLIEGFAIVCLVMFLMNVQPFFDASSLLADSFFYGLMNTYIPQVKDVISNV
ncbi:MAG: CvpA family protein [Treponema sp.]|nr:CvpA family protein [Treponema sp.]